MVVVWSRTSVKSQWVRHEAGRGLELELGRALRATQRLETENRRLRRDGLPTLIGEAKAMQPALRLRRRQLENPLDNLADASIAAGQKRAQQHARVVGAQILT